MRYLLVFTFYRGDDIVGIDATQRSEFVTPQAIATMPLVAPAVTESAVVSLSDLDTDEVLWIAGFDAEEVQGGEIN